MKTSISFVWGLLLLLQPFQHSVFAQPTFDECYYLLNQKIQRDLEISYPLLTELKKKDNAWIYNIDDLIKMKLPIGKEDTHLDSLISLFSGSFIGEKQLIISSGEYDPKWGNSFTGYIFYKEIDGSNILLKVKRGLRKWEVVEKRKIPGRYITLREINKDCIRNN